VGEGRSEEVDDRGLSVLLVGVGLALHRFGLGAAAGEDRAGVRVAFEPDRLGDRGAAGLLGRALGAALDLGGLGELLASLAFAGADEAALLGLGLGARDGGGAAGLGVEDGRRLAGLG